MTNTEFSAIIKFTLSLVVLYSIYYVGHVQDQKLLREIRENHKAPEEPYENQR